MTSRLAALVATCIVVGACGGSAARTPEPPRPTPAGPARFTSADPLGERPAFGEPPLYTPPVPVTYKRPNGLTVWLVERHALPLVSLQLVVPAGSAQDPPGKGGLALMTANMLDEGAGARGPLELSRDIDRLGATLETGAYSDYAFVALTALKRNFAPAMGIFGDVVQAPQFAPAEWRRVSDLWKNDLLARQSDPDAVANVVAVRRFFGAAHPYGHPTGGTTLSAAKVGLPDVKAFYDARYRPDLATCVVVGDVTRAELDSVLDASLGRWSTERRGVAEAAGGSGQASTKGASPAPARGGGGASKRVIVVDRADAPQAVIAVVSEGVAAGEEDAPPLVRVNAALGGSFTSRLNQELREARNFSYGARSRFSFSRERGPFVAQAAVYTEKTGEALKVMLGELEALQRAGLTDEEVAKTRLLARAELVESFEGVQTSARRLARNAGVGLGPDREMKASARTDAATKRELDRLAASYVDPSRALVVVVGPRAKIEPQLRAVGINEFTTSGPEGE